MHHKRGADRSPRPSAALLARPVQSGRSLVSQRGLVHLLDVFPIYQMIEKRLDVIRPPVAVVDIVRVLPNIAAQNRFGTVHQWVLAIRRFSHSNLAVLDGQPSPSGSELSDASGNELLLHLVVRTK